MINYEKEFKELILHTIETACENISNDDVECEITKKYPQKIFPKIGYITIQRWVASGLIKDRHWLKISVLINSDKGNSSVEYFNTSDTEILDNFDRYRKELRKFRSIEKDKEDNHKLRIIRNAISNILDK